MQEDCVTLNRVLTRLIWLCVSPLVVVGTFLVIFVLINSEKIRQREAANIAKDLAVAVDQHLSSRVGALQMLADSPLMDNVADRKVLYREARGFYANFGSHVVLGDAESHMLLNTRVPFGTPLPPLPRPRGHAAAPTALKTGKPAIGDTFPGPIAKETLVAIAVPVVREGKNMSVLLTTFEARRFAEFLDRVTLPAGWCLALRDGRNAIIARRPASGPNTASPHSHRLVVKSSVSPWSVVLEIPPVAYWKPLIQAGVFLSIIILCAAFVSVAGGLRTSRRIGRSVALLAEPPTAAAPVPDIAEIAAVRRALDDMSEKRDKADAARSESEEQFRVLTQNLESAVALIDERGAFSIVNNSFLRLFDIPEDADIVNVNNRDWAQWQVLDETGRLLYVDDHPVRKAASTGRPVRNQLVAVKTPSRPDLKWLLVSAEPILDEKKGIRWLICTYYDITDRKAAEEALRKAHNDLALEVEARTRELREKEVLLKEVHHRVKNNLQVISSLVSLQADGSKDETVREVLDDVTYRVRSMALVHEKLYRSADLAHVDFAEYSRSLLSYLWSAHGAAASSVRLILDLDSVTFPVDVAVPCGLMLNELVGNALKHAFPDRGEGRITVSLHNEPGGQVRLSVRDNGVGLPDGLDWREAKSLGLRLVQMLAKQLGATVEAGSNNGTKFEIAFSTSTPPPREEPSS
jgi:two-component sensor histidine kinase/PAS domain-containing protein